MKKLGKWMALALMLAALLLCAACGGGAGDPQDSIPPEDDPNEGLGGEATPLDTENLAGIYLPEDAASEWSYLEIQADGTWSLDGENAVLTGWLGYDSEYDAYYAYDDGDDSGCLFEVTSDGRVYLAAYGYFTESGMEDIWYDDGGGDHDGDPVEDDVPIWTEDDTPERMASPDPELYQREAAELAGIWYYDGDLDAERFIVIDDGGSWTYYQRTPGEENEELDSGYFTYSATEASVYYAESAIYDGVFYRVFDFDSDILVWGDEGTYEWME